jgi:hypothetical protein
MNLELLISSIVTALVGGGLIFKMFDMGKALGSIKSDIKSLNEKYDSLDKKIDKVKEDIESRISRLPCDVHSDRLSDTEKDVAFFRGKTEFILSAKQSPRTLNKYGQELFQEIDGESFLAENKQKLFDFIDAESPKTAYDVEADARKAVHSLTDDDSFNRIKVWLYNSPAKKIEVEGKETEYCFSLEDACFVISLPLRDMYIESHPTILK